MQAPLDPPYRPCEDSPRFALVVLLAALAGLALVTWVGLHLWDDVVSAAAALPVPAVLRA